MTKRRVDRCPCGSHACRDWHVHPEVALQGTGFRSERRARLVARFLDLLDEYGDDLDSLSLVIGRDAVERDISGPVVRRVADRETRKVTCPVCHGEGGYVESGDLHRSGGWMPCHHCGKTGVVDA